MLLRVNPVKSFSPNFLVPSSKPETQRAILVASLAEGDSVIYNDLRCTETQAMKDACRAIGSNIKEYQSHLEIHGVGNKLKSPSRIINCHGSGLVFRVFTALTSFTNKPTILTGDKILCQRIMQPLFDGLSALGAEIESICSLGKAPVVNRGLPLKGGKVYLPGNISSQFVTAILFAAPYANEPIEIILTGEAYSHSYIFQTIKFMQDSGIKVEHNDSFTYYKVYPGLYNKINIRIKEDYTSASYLLVTAALFKGEMVFNNIDGHSLQGERAILSILEKIGITYHFKSETKELIVNNPHDYLSGEYEFDAKNYPNIVPTLAVLGSFICGRFKVYGASVTQFHKAPRIEAMVSELTKLGVDIKILYNNENVCDGFEIFGKKEYSGGVVFSNWEDHRIFMSLFVASLKTKNPCYLQGHEEVACSFPTFLEEFKNFGVETHMTPEIDLEKNQPNYAVSH